MYIIQGACEVENILLELRIGTFVYTIQGVCSNF